MKTVALVQARMGSTRLLNKVMKPINGVPMIGLLLQRLSKSKKIDQIVLVTTRNKKEKPLIDYVSKIGFEVFQGSENDVLSRYYHAAKKYNADAVVRVTGDCPIIDPEIVDDIVQEFYNNDVDYLSNTLKPTFPDGLDASITGFSALEVAYNEATTDYDREYVVNYIRESGKFKLKNYINDIDYSFLRLTVDEYADFSVINKLFNHFSPSIDFSLKEIIKLYKKKPHIFDDNKHISRDEGSKIGSGQKLWKRAKQIIPGGNMLFSKRSEMFLPQKWPSYFSKAKGCTVWDLDGNKYIDMSIMGVGTNILGYGHDEVDAAVHTAITNGNMSTLNCPEEVFLAERLLELHPWADMARFARTGGEANAIAIRIARAYKKKEKVAVCGYHGWHDWYLAANLDSSKNLDGHLLPGLETNGISKELEGSIFTFDYNNIEQLRRLVVEHDIGIIKMEVSRNHEPKDDFLKNVRELASDNEIVLIFDECTSGFRQTFGGLHKFYGVDPDMAVFGKAMGNGYPITAIIGKRDIMEAAQTTFISSTFWTDRIGPTAALKTLEVMERIKSWEIISEIGNRIKSQWLDLGNSYDLPLDVFGPPALIKFTINSNNMRAYKTLITQEMLKKGYLSTNSLNVSISHSTELLDGYYNALGEVFDLISQCEVGSQDIHKLLEGPICHADFRRLN